MSSCACLSVAMSFFVAKVNPIGYYGKYTYKVAMATIQTICYYDL